jgi:hypothetical protein
MDDQATRLPLARCFAGVRVRDQAQASAPAASTSWNPRPTNQDGIAES